MTVSTTVLSEVVECLAQEFQLSDDDRSQRLGSGQTRLHQPGGLATIYIKKAGLLRSHWPGTLPADRTRS